MQGVHLGQVALQGPGHRLVPLDEPGRAGETNGPFGLVESVDHFDVVGPGQQGVGVGVEQEGGN